MSGGRAAVPQRSRRWDAVVLGGALPGLVAAARLAIAGQRVLLLEEAAATAVPDAVREPFFLAGARGGILEACLRELGLPLIERRALVPEPVAFQMILPDARIDLGEPQLTVDELVAWGVAKPEPARALLRALGNASQAELAAMQAAAVVKAGALRSLSRGGSRPSLHGRGLPVEASAAEGVLAAVLDAQVRALSNLGGSAAPPEARARLLGAALSGGACFESPELGLRELLRRRIKARHGELRTVDRPFAFAVAGEHPAVAMDGARELWAGRVLVVNAPLARLGRQLADWGQPAPAFLQNARPAGHRRVAVHLRCESAVVPEAMGRALVRVGDAGLPCDGTNVISIARHPRPAAGDAPLEQDLVASAVVEDRPGARAAVEQEIEAAVRELMPFCEGRVVREPLSEPGWDDEGLLGDPARGEGWPGELEVRASSRPPVYVLPREGLAALGLEGDLLLGWRAGDAIAAALA